MMKLQLLFFFCFLSIIAKAQTEDEQIKATINRTFVAMQTTDSTLLKTALYSSCFLKTVVKTKEGETKLIEEPIQKFIEAIGTKHEGTLYEERLLSYDIKIDGDMAVVWCPYNFYVNNQLRHCGVDSFSLMKTKDGWKIIGIVDTRRKNCEK